MPADVEQILRDKSVLWSQMEPWREDWQQIADVMLPGQSDILTLRQPGQRRTRQLYDSTALWALDTFVAHLSAWITNFQTQWFSLRMRALPDDQEAARWLDEVATILWENMVANDAPMPTAVNEGYRSYAGFGTALLFLDEAPMPDNQPRLGFRGFQAENVPTGRYGLMENASRRVDGFIREFEYSPKQAEEAWGLDALHEDMRLSLTDPSQSAQKYVPVQFLHAVFPRRERDAAQTDSMNMPWASVYIDSKYKHKIHEGGYRWFPGMGFRWEKLAAYNPFGFGRGHLTLPEARSLQLIDQDMLKALGTTIQPPGWLVGASRETVNNVSLLPGALNPLAAGGDFIPYSSGNRPDLAQLQITERRERILRAFFIDQLQFLPPADQRTQRTLGEIQIRARQMMRIMGPYLMRLIPEFLNPFIDINFALNLQAGELPDPPDVVIDAALQQQGKIDTEYEGVLARSQRDGESDAIAEGIEFVTSVARETQDPVVLENIEMDDAVARWLETRGFPKSVVTDRRLVQEIRTAARQQAAKEAENEQATQEAQAARDVAPMLREVREVVNA